MLQKKRKGRLQKGIMVAVSALTVLASASTALAYQPMQSSDMSFEETISNNADFYGFGDFAFTIDLSQIDFSKSDCVFVDENGQQEPVYNIGSERAWKNLIFLHPESVLTQRRSGKAVKNIN